MGLAHLTFLKQYVKGAIFALIEIVVLLMSPHIVRTIVGMITLGDPKPGLTVFE